MRIMCSGSDTSQEVHWGQCFEEFYGPEYCKNLRKDLEKLKDEFYDGNPQRFQREWVVPTAELLRRMRFMGFPVRTRDYIIIHLYNPVDSMCAGEMHFQVGRKVPGTLTLKFTKQSHTGAFVIQPKTLNNEDEMQLKEAPAVFLDKVRLEMMETSLGIASMFQTLVLMTDSCKLERQPATTLFSILKPEMNMPYPIRQPPLQSQISHDYPSFTPLTSLPSNVNQWTVKNTLPSNVFNQENAMFRSEGTFPVPCNFYVKNYVHCNGRDVPNEVQLHTAKPALHHHYNAPHRIAGGPYRLPRSITVHSEPEENDETLEPLSHSEQHWSHLPPVSVEDIQRRMSDSRLWDAVKPTAGPSVDPISTHSGHNKYDGSGSRLHGPNAAGTNTNVPFPGMNTRSWGLPSATSCRPMIPEGIAQESPQTTFSSGRAPSPTSPFQRQISASATMEYYGLDRNIAIAGFPPTDFSRRFSEPKGGSTCPTTYLQHQAAFNTTFTNGSGPKPIGSNSRTSLTEEYAGESQTAEPRDSGAGQKSDKAFSGYPVVTINPDPEQTRRTSDCGQNVSSGKMSPRRTSLVDQYAGSTTPVTQRGEDGLKKSTLMVEPEFVHDTQDGRRTSSLDGYIGIAATATLMPNTASQIRAARSDNNLASSSKPSQQQLFSRTKMVDDYFKAANSSDKNLSTLNGLLRPPEAGNGGTRPLNVTTSRSNEHLPICTGDAKAGQMPSLSPAFLMPQTMAIHDTEVSIVQNKRSNAADLKTGNPTASITLTQTTNGYFERPEAKEEDSTSLESWMSHAQLPESTSNAVKGTSTGLNNRQGSNFANQLYIPGRFPTDQQEYDVGNPNDFSLISNNSFPTWGSHHAWMPTSPGAAMIPLVVEEINQNSPSWQQWTPANSIN